MIAGVRRTDPPLRWMALTVAVCIAIGVIAFHRSGHSPAPLTVIGISAGHASAGMPAGWPTSAQLAAAARRVPLPPPAPLHRPLRCITNPGVSITVTLSDSRIFQYASCQIPPALMPAVRALRPSGGWPRPV